MAAHFALEVRDPSDLEALASYANENGMTVEDAILDLAVEGARDYLDGLDDDDREHDGEHPARHDADDDDDDDDEEDDGPQLRRRRR